MPASSNPPSAPIGAAPVAARRIRDAPPDASSSGGQGLLAHELTHVVQQGGAAPRRVDPAADSAAAPSKVRRRDDAR